MWSQPAFPYTSPHATFWVMRKYLDTVSVVWEKILLRPPSLGGRLTDRKSEEQQADELVSSTIDCQLTSKVRYTDRPAPQHDDLHSTNAFITTYESLTGTNLSHAWPLFALPCFLSTVGLHLPGQRLGLNFTLSIWWKRFKRGKSHT